MTKKTELLEQAKELGVNASAKNTIAEIQSMINESGIADSQTTVEKVAKAGKHSSKGIKESEEKLAKIERQHQKNESNDNADQPETVKPKSTIKPTRSKLVRRGKNYQKVAKLIKQNQEYTLTEALDLALKTNPSKFNASVELHVKLGVDPRQADQNIRGVVNLPSGSGKNIRVAVFAETDDVKKAVDAGADVAGADEFLQLLDKEQLDFDILISTPNMMAKLSKYARLLGPKGLMPNPKSGTVTKDVATAVKESKTGKVEYRVDTNGIVHLVFGKTNFALKDLETNVRAILSALKIAKPSSLKGSYVETIYVTTTMGPSIKILSSEF